MKGKPEDLTRIDPQLHYVMRLCHLSTSTSQAVDWVKRLGDLQKAFPSDREILHHGEIDLLDVMAIMINFIENIAIVLPMPSFSRKSGQNFTCGLWDLSAELSEFENVTDLRDFAVPIDNMLEPDMAEKMMHMIGQFVVQKSGASMKFLFGDLVDE